MTTEERLETVESALRETQSSLRNARRFMGLAGLVALGALCVAAAKGPNIVKAQGFVITDSAGHDMALFGIHKGRPDLLMLDEKGKVRVDLCEALPGPYLRMVDAAGVVRTSLTVANEGGALTVNDEKGQVRVGLGDLSHGPDLSFFDDKGKVTWKAH